MRTTSRAVRNVWLMFASAAVVASSGVEVAGVGVDVGADAGADGATALLLAGAPLSGAAGAVAAAAAAAADVGLPPVAAGGRVSCNTK